MTSSALPSINRKPSESTLPASRVGNHPSASTTDPLPSYSPETCSPAHIFHLAHLERLHFHPHHEFPTQFLVRADQLYQAPSDAFIELLSFAVIIRLESDRRNSLGKTVCIGEISVWKQRHPFSMTLEGIFPPPYDKLFR